MLLSGIMAHAFLNLAGSPQTSLLLVPGVLFV